MLQLVVAEIQNIPAIPVEGRHASSPRSNDVPASSSPLQQHVLCESRWHSPMVVEDTSGELLRLDLSSVHIAYPIVA